MVIWLHRNKFNWELKEKSKSTFCLLSLKIYTTKQKKIIPQETGLWVQLFSIIYRLYFIDFIWFYQFYLLHLILLILLILLDFIDSLHIYENNAKLLIL